MPLAPTRDLRVTVRRGQRLETRVRAPDEVDGPVSEGERMGQVVGVDRRRGGRPGRRSAATRAAAAASLLERYDAAIPGPRAVAWGVAIAALALVLIGAVAIWDRRR